MRMGSEIRRYEAACDILPPRLRRLALAVDDHRKERVEELRLRVGRPMTLLLPEGEITAAPRDREALVMPEDLQSLVSTVTEYSRYAASETLRRGYLCGKGGLRIGVCGSAVVRDGRMDGLRDFSSAAIRLVRERIGVAAALVDGLYEDGRLQSTLLLSPPGGGKTTLLRDLIRCVSLGSATHGALRVSVVDERGELAVSLHGEAQMELGNHTDILDGCPKALGIETVLRVMNPQVIAVDEITAQEDIAAIARAASCGVALLATLHAGSVGELRQKPLCRRLLDARVFTRAVTIVRDGETRRYEAETLC